MHFKWRLLGGEDLWGGRWRLLHPGPRKVSKIRRHLNRNQEQVRGLLVNCAMCPELSKYTGCTQFGNL